LCCKRHEVHNKTEIMSQSKKEVNGNHDWKPGARCQFLIQVWNFLKKYTRPPGAISTSQWFCAWKVVQISTSQQFYFVDEKSYKVLCAQFCPWKILQKVFIKWFVHQWISRMYN
jgi:hypothetical protein